MKYRNMFGKEYEVVFQIKKYLSTGNTSVQMLYFDDDCECWLPYGSVTVNLDERLPEGQAYIDVNNFGIGIEDFLVGNGLASPAGWYKKSGFCDYPLYNLNLEEIKRYC